MKNIFLIPTPDESRIAVKSDGFLFLTNHPYPNSPKFANHHIYVTKNEDIKEGVEQWYLDKVLNEPYNSGGAQYSSKQDVIVLTDDKKLIADGVQPIPDDFLEWFVDNQTCEEIEVEEEKIFSRYSSLDKLGSTHISYELIIPKQQDEYYHYSGLPSPAAYVEKPIAVQGGGNLSFAASTVIVVGSGLPPAKLTLELTQKEARGLLNCLIRTHANGTDLDVGEVIEEKLLEFLKPLEK